MEREERNGSFEQGAVFESIGAFIAVCAIELLQSKAIGL